MNKKKTPKIAIILVNYKSPYHTIECVESVIKSNYENFQLIIVDNYSKDDSVSIIKKYLEGEIKANCEELHKDKVFPLHEGKLDYLYINEDNIDKNHINGNVFKKIVFIENNGNYGFGGGNNRGIKFSLTAGNFDYVWLLNNDTVIDKNTLSFLVEEAEKSGSTGFVGSSLIYYHKPDTIQAVGGGKFYPILGLSKLYMKGANISSINKLTIDEIKKNINYIMGASLLLSVPMLEEIGLFDEQFFLYSEETDLFLRGIKKGWDYSVAKNSFVYHKQSATTKELSEVYYYNLTKSTLILLKKHYTKLFIFTSLPLLFLNTLRTTLKIKNWKYTLKGIKDGLF